MGVRFLASFATFVAGFVLLMPAACDDPGLDPSYFLTRCTTFIGTPAPSWQDLTTVDLPGSYGEVITLVLIVLLSIGTWFFVKLMQKQMEQ